MADVKNIKIPSDFFESEPIITILGMYGIDADSTILLYLHMLCEAYKKSRKGVFSIANIPLTDDALAAVFRYDSLSARLRILEHHGLIAREERAVTVFKFWEDRHDRSSDRYKEWRSSVFIRDGFQCKKCGTKKDLQAHHIKPWKSNKDLRYSISNGVTLCRKCHLEAHGGCWHGRKANVHAEDH